MDDALLYASAATLARAIRDKQVSATEVVEAHLARIDTVNPALNAVVKLCADRALEEAAASDRGHDLRIGEHVLFDEAQLKASNLQIPGRVSIVRPPPATL